MSDRIIFFNTGWMDFYKGILNDKIVGGGKHVDSEGWGGEMFNFHNFNNNLYGYVQPKIDRKYKNPPTIKLEKIGGSKTDESIDNVTVVWTAKEPNKGGTYIIGWYKNATIYRYLQKPPRNSNRKYKNNLLGYFTTTNSKDGKLLSIDERIISIPRQEKNWMGQSNVWYADKNPEFVKLVKKYIFKGKTLLTSSNQKQGKGSPRQTNPLKRIEVEEKAVLLVTDYYKKLGFIVESFEKDNVGWDLTATNDRTELKLEVKGLSGINIATELTPNEFKNLKSDLKFYRLCIVTETLTKPKLKIFAFSKENKQWTSEDGTVIKFKEVISARIYV